MGFLDLNGLKRFKNKLDEKYSSPIEAIRSWQPAGSGRSGQILRSNGDGTTSWQDVATSQDVAEAVDNWMDDHISPNTAIALDDSLTSTTAAAQGAAAGSMVLVSDSQPSATTNKLWIKQTPDDEILIPTMTDHNRLASEVEMMPHNDDSDAVDVDLDITDRYGNVIMRLADGHVQTKEFNSRDINTDNIAPDYDDLTFPVSKGKRCYHNNTIYKAKQNIPSIEEWNGEHWELENIGDSLAAIDGEIVRVTNDVMVKPDIDDVTPARNKTYSSAKVEDEISRLDTAMINTTKVADPNASDADLYLCDEAGHVIAEFINGHIVTKYFDSAHIDHNATPAIETFSASKTYVRGAVNTINVSGDFHCGDEIYYHMIDGHRYDDYGRYAAYYEGNKLVIANRRGSNGYVRHIVTADCASVGVSIGGSEYTDGTEIVLDVYRKNKDVEPKIVTVKSDGTGMFSTIKEAVDSITDANHLTNPYIIEVYPGTYDCLEGYTDEEIASAGTGTYTQDSMVGIKLRDGMSLRGVGRRDDIILTAELDTTRWNSDVRGQISTLNIEGEGSIENVTIEGKNIRYCVHDDFTSPTNSHDKRVLRNLKFKGEYLSYYPHFTTYGAGMTAPRDYLIENCDFGYDLGIHRDSGYTFGCTIEVNNCSGCRFRIGDNASAESNAKNRVILNNCNFQVIRTRHTDNTLSNHMILEGVGGENSMIRDVNPNLYRLGTVDLTQTGLTTGTLVKRDVGSLGFVATNNIADAYGVVIGSDSEYSYVQKAGYVSSVMLNLQGLAIGDYVTVNASTNMIEGGGTASNAVGVVKATDTDGAAYIKLTI